MKAISLFSGAGIGELLLKEINIDISVANEIDHQRCEVYEFLNPNVKMIEGDITEKEIKTQIIKHSSKIDLIMATPPCQGISSIGKNKIQDHFVKDRRNYLIFDFIDIFKKVRPNFGLVENVERFSKMFFPYKDNLCSLHDILKYEFGDEYKIDSSLLNFENYGIPQSRPRSLYRIYKKNKNWLLPQTEEKISLKQSIGHLPSLDPGEISDIPWHYAKQHKAEVVECLRHTPEGKSALYNNVFYPKNKNGEKIKGFHNTYKRMTWKNPCHARTTYMGSLSSHNNVHPGHKLKDGTYSDPRVLTLLETFIVSTIPEDITFPNWASDNLIRTIIGEGIPPLFLTKILAGIQV